MDVARDKGHLICVLVLAAIQVINHQNNQNTYDNGNQFLISFFNVYIF